MLNFRVSGASNRKLLATWKLVSLKQQLVGLFLFEHLEVFLRNAANSANMCANNWWLTLSTHEQNSGK